MSDTALVVVDVQLAFDDPAWGPRNNPACEENVLALADDARRRGDALVYVRHDSTEPGSLLAPGEPGNELRPELRRHEPDLLVTKDVNSAFLGRPGLHGWLTDRGITTIAICGVQTNFCCETTARMGGNLGYDVRFVLDATHTFDLRSPSGRVFPADDVAEMTAANLDGEFATVLGTADYLKR
jgi:nicotinamidase-related amidase